MNVRNVLQHVADFYAAKKPKRVSSGQPLYRVLIPSARLPF
jgi:hypothetical protein